jgi:hypothetical protein
MKSYLFRCKLSPATTEAKGTALCIKRAKFKIAPAHPILIHRSIVLGKDNQLLWGTLILHRALSSGVLPQLQSGAAAFLVLNPMRCVALYGAVAFNRKQLDSAATLGQSCASSAALFVRQRFVQRNEATLPLDLMQQCHEIHRVGQGHLQFMPLIC